MNTKIVLLDVIIFLVILIPIAFLIIYTMGSDKKVKRNINKLCNQQGIHLDHIEINGDLVLGLDNTNKKLVCSERKNTEDNFQVFDLKSLSDCKVKVLKLANKTTDWVGLELVSAEDKKEIPFYIENDDDGPASDPKIREQQAIKWERLIKPHLKVS